MMRSFSALVEFPAVYENVVFLMGHVPLKT